MSLIKKEALLLGMVYALEERGDTNGQMFRDRVRCIALEKLGYHIRTMDDKHDGDGSSCLAEPGTHCRANFAAHSRMRRSMLKTWGHISFKLIVLDYFFCPAGYVNTRWTEGFFKNTLPLIAMEKVLSDDGELWLPHVYYVEQMLQKYCDELSVHYDWFLVNDPKKNPLYLATDNVEHLLLKCPDRRTNQNQILPLKEISDDIFFVLKHKKIEVSSATPVKSRVSKKRPVPEIHSLDGDLKVEKSPTKARK